MVFTSISLGRDSSRDWNLGLTSLVLADNCWQCCTRAETIWVMVTDSTVDSGGGTSACLPHQIPHSPSHRLVADGLSHQHGWHQVRDNHLAGKDRHNCGQEMISGWPPVSLPSRLTESMVWSKDRIRPGPDS